MKYLISSKVAVIISFSFRRTFILLPHSSRFCHLLFASTYLSNLPPLQHFPTIGRTDCVMVNCNIFHHGWSSSKFNQYNHYYDEGSLQITTSFLLTQLLEEQSWDCLFRNHTFLFCISIWANERAGLIHLMMTMMIEKVIFQSRNYIF